MPNLYDRLFKLSLDDLEYLRQYGTPEEKAAALEVLIDTAPRTLRWSEPAASGWPSASLAGDEPID